MPEFLQSTAGRAILGVIIAAAIILIIDLNYRLITKLVLDFLFALIAIIICSPLLVFGAIVSKGAEGKVLESKAYAGVKGKIIYLHAFTGLESGLKYLPRLLDILCGRLSFVGVKPMEPADCPLMNDEQMERFNARPGMFCHLILKGSEGLTYEDMFGLDARYAKKRELFTDIFIVLKTFAYSVRGEGKTYLGEACEKSYGEVLLERGTISARDFERAAAFAAEAISAKERPE